MRPVEWRDLSDQKISSEGRRALENNPEAWKHAETEHFVYHFRDEKLAETVLMHAEAYYDWIKQFFGIASGVNSNVRCHVYVFEDRKLWEAFKSLSSEHFPGVEAYTNGSELFIYRDSYYLTPQKVLAHELSHIVLHHFLSANVPLFLNEGFADYVSYKALALQADGNEFSMHTLQKIPEAAYIPLTRLSAMTEYPEDTRTFYLESELLVRYLIRTFGKDRFYDLLRRVASGELFEKSLNSIYDMDLKTLDEKFRADTLISH